MQSEGNWGGGAGRTWVERKERFGGGVDGAAPPFVPGPSKKFKVMLYSALENTGRWRSASGAGAGALPVGHVGGGPGGLERSNRRVLTVDNVNQLAADGGVGDGNEGAQFFERGEFSFAVRRARGPP
jgi:hypothetical protein